MRGIHCTCNLDPKSCECPRWTPLKDQAPGLVGATEAAPEWHLANLLNFICPDPKNLRGLKNNDGLNMEVSLRVGDVRAAHASLMQCFGSKGTEEARWIEDTENACPYCGGSGHKDDIAAPEAKHTDTLVARLRSFAAWYVSCAGGNVPPEAADADAAADRITQLEAESAELRGKLEKAEAEAWEKGFTAGWENAGSCDDNPPSPYLTEKANIRSPVQSQMAKMVDPRKDEK